MGEKEGASARERAGMAFVGFCWGRRGRGAETVPPGERGGSVGGEGGEVESEGRRAEDGVAGLMTVFLVSVA
jgi:hypothetical protein